MADCIEREALTNALDELCDRVCQYSKKQRHVMCGACPLGGAFDVVEAIPAAEAKPQTNADRIRAMTDEEMADRFSDGCCREGYAFPCSEVGCKKCWLQWLKQEVET